MSKAMVEFELRKLVPIAHARRLIETAERPLADNVLRNAARRLSVLETNEQGRAAISAENIEILRHYWRAFGALHPRGVRTLGPSV
jgi:hypothetical protein